LLTPRFMPKADIKPASSVWFGHSQPTVSLFEGRPTSRVPRFRATKYACRKIAKHFIAGSLGATLRRGIWRGTFTKQWVKLLQQRLIPANEGPGLTKYAGARNKPLRASVRVAACRRAPKIRVVARNRSSRAPRPACKFPILRVLVGYWPPGLLRGHHSTEGF